MTRYSQPITAVQFNDNSKSKLQHSLYLQFIADKSSQLPPLALSRCLPDDHSEFLTLAQPTHSVVSATGAPMAQDPLTNPPSVSIKRSSSTRHRCRTISHRSRKSAPALHLSYQHLSSSAHDAATTTTTTCNARTRILGEESLNA